MSNVNEKFVTVGVIGMIPELRINGPIKTPIMMNIDHIRSMVFHGRRVYEHNPAKPSEKVLLTIENVDKENFGKDAKKKEESVVKTQAAPAPVAVEETPVVPVDDSPVKEDVVEEQPAEAEVTSEDQVEAAAENQNQDNKNQQYTGKKNKKR